jgi:hypothetical protein
MRAISLRDSGTSSRKVCDFVYLYMHLSFFDRDISQAHQRKCKNAGAKSHPKHPASLSASLFSSFLSVFCCPLLKQISEPGPVSEAVAKSAAFHFIFELSKDMHI